jgi:hypothetical protein
VLFPTRSDAAFLVVVVARARPFVPSFPCRLPALPVGLVALLCNLARTAPVLTASAPDVEARAVASTGALHPLVLDAGVAQGLSSSDRLSLFRAFRPTRVSAAGVEAAGALPAEADEADRDGDGDGEDGAGDLPAEF